MILIGVCGKAGAGKDTIGDRLCTAHHFVRYALADPIKDMLEVMGVDARNRNTREAPHPLFHISPRRMAQTLGTEWGRNLVHPDVWLKVAKEFYRTRDSKMFEGVVITDVRFENEAEWIRDYGFLIHVIRPDVGEVERHTSEDGVNTLPKDHIIINSGTKEFLNRKVDIILDAIKKSK